MLAFLCLCLALTCGTAQGQDNVMDYLANNLQIRFTVLDNLNRDEFFQFSGRIDVTNTGPSDITDNTWQIYFCSIRLFEVEFLRNRSNDGAELGTSRVKVYHVDGCLHRLQPMEDFPGFATDQTVELPFRASDWMVSRTDVMPRWYVTVDGIEARTIVSTASESLDFVADFTTPQQWKRMEGDQYDPPTAHQRYDDTVATDLGEAPKPVIPTPVEVELSDTEFVDISTTDWVVVYTSQSLQQEAQFLAEKLGTVAVDENNRPSSKYIQVNLGDVDGGQINNNEGYEVRVMVQSSVINITGINESGVFYGVQTVLALAQDPRGVPEGAIVDYPRFSYRGMHLDVGRNFVPKEEVMKLLDVMAMYKMNQFHFHITEDEGWRLEIPGIEEATEVGSRRCFDLDEDTCIISQLGSGPYPTTSGTGYYTVDEYKEILRYANERHITVTPEFDTPGHSHAIVRAMEARFRRYNETDMEKATEFLLTDPEDTSEYESAQIYTKNVINVCMNTPYDFIRKLIQEVKAMHEDIQPLKTFNFGGDEVPDGSWLQSPVCKNFTDGNPDFNLTRVDLQRYFAIRVAEIAYEEGLDVAAWEDGLGYINNPFDRELIPNDNAYVFAWENVWEWGNGDAAYSFANADYQVILSHATHLYYDHPQEPHPEERGYYWATRYTDTYKTFGYYPDDIYNNIQETGMGVPIDKEEFCAPMDVCVPLNESKRANVIGMQGHLWSETSRTPAQMDSMIYPRIVAMAERAWHKAGWEETLEKGEKDLDWEQFANTLGHRELARLDSAGVMYNLPPPGARLNEVDTLFMLEANVKFPGLPIVYSTDGGATWSTYTGPVDVPPGSDVHVQVRSADGSRGSRTEVIQALPVSGAPTFTATTCLTLASSLIMYTCMMQ